MPSDEAQQVLAAIKEQRAAAAVAGGASPDPVAMRQNAVEPPPPPPDTTVSAVDAGGVHAEWVLAPGADEDTRLLYFHGGGYVLGSALGRRQLCAHLSAAAGCAVLNTDYRLAPEHPYPAAVEDGITALRWMRAQGPSGGGVATSAFIAGDSAGGGLALATMMKARDAGDPACEGVIGISAWTDLSMSGASIESRREHDPTVTREALDAFAAYYLAGTNSQDALASPVFGEFKGLPPLLMQVGDDEVILDDSTRVVEQAKAAGVDATLEVYPEMWHVFQLNVDMPEARQAITQIGSFVRQRIGAVV